MSHCEFKWAPQGANMVLHGQPYSEYPARARACVRRRLSHMKVSLCGSECRLHPLVAARMLGSPGARWAGGSVLLLLLSSYSPAPGNPGDGPVQSGGSHGSLLLLSDELLPCILVSCCYGIGQQLLLSTSCSTVNKSVHLYIGPKIATSQKFKFDF